MLRKKGASIYPKAKGTSDSSSPKEKAWVQINGSWRAFDDSGYLKTGWIEINGKRYYFNPIPDGTKGILQANRRTPDGWFLTEDGKSRQFSCEAFVSVGVFSTEIK